MSKPDPVSRRLPTTVNADSQRNTTGVMLDFRAGKKFLSSLHCAVVIGALGLCVFWMCSCMIPVKGTIDNEYWPKVFNPRCSVHNCRMRWKMIGIYGENAEEHFRNDPHKYLIAEKYFFPNAKVYCFKKDPCERDRQGARRMWACPKCEQAERDHIRYVATVLDGVKVKEESIQQQINNGSPETSSSQQTTGESVTNRNTNIGDK